MDEKTMLTLDTASPEETEAMGRLIGENSPAGLFIGLRGELGAGKTVMVRGIARGLGIQGPVTSPTFQLVREYPGRETLFHFDFYRLDSAGDAVDLDIAGCLTGGIVAAEWSDMFTELGGGDRLVISLSWTGENNRRISIEEASGSGLPILELLQRKHG